VRNALSHFVKGKGSQLTCYFFGGIELAITKLWIGVKPMSQRNNLTIVGRRSALNLGLPSLCNYNAANSHQQQHYHPLSHVRSFYQ
jgi:hypothetical protein